MPILAHETDLYPEGLLIDPTDTTTDSRWWVLYTLSRREKQLSRCLLNAEVPFYSPLIAKRNRSPQGRIRTSYVPLFPGYVFLYGGESQRQIALTSNCVSQCIRVPNGQQLQSDLKQIRDLVETGVPLTAESRIEPGQTARIRAGVFAGLEGTILKRHSKTRLVIAIQFLQRGASVLLEDCELELT